MIIHIKGDMDNDFVKILEQSGMAFRLFSDCSQAVKETPEDGVLFVLAEDYPGKPFCMDKAFLEGLEEKRIKAYVEYACIEEADRKTAVWERSVVGTSLFKGLEEGDIIDQHGCVYLDVSSENTLLHIAKVAGYEKACFGLPKENASLLYMLSDNVMVCTTRLSDYVRQRISPSGKVHALFEGILGYLTGTPAILERLEPPVDLNGRTDGLECFNNSIGWFTRNIICATDKKVSPSEGYGSHIEYDGHQRRNAWVRGDCTAEVALAMAVDWKVNSNLRSRDLAVRMLDYLWKSTDFVVREDVPIKGMTNWSSDSRVYYGDDNARVILATFKAMELLGCNDWERELKDSLYANLLVTGKNGFRRSRIDYPGESGAFDGIILAPHYQCYLWACFLEGSRLYNDKEMYHKAQTGIDIMMDGFDSEWTWTNGITQEYARMLLPLACASRLHERNRGYLDRMLDALAENLHPSGAIMERLGDDGKGKYPQLKSNEEYGINESPVIQKNGDPVTDLLYTLGFAFLGLYEARDLNPKAEMMYRGIKDFLCRIQVKSTTHPYLHGAWLRSFDLRGWEYHGSSSDIGWGAWCAESGWNNAWTAVVLGLDSLGKPFLSR
ncbi:MAG: hypothetical protein R6W96_07125 [Clostridia bacterium]